MYGLLRGLGAAALFLVLALGCDSVTPVAPADAVLTLTVNPTRITSDGQATITVLARKTDGFPVNEGTEISFSTTLGRLDPEVAFTDEQGRATTILFGNGEVGIATITAVSGSVQVGGGEAGIEVQIGSIPNSLLLEVTPGEISIQEVDRERSFKLRASVVDDLGDPLQGTTVRFQSEVGKLDSRGDPVETNANGVARDTLTVKKNQLENAGSSFFVSATVTGGDTEGFIELFAEEEVFIFGFPFDIFLETSQSSVPAEGASIQLIATVLDDFGEPLAGAKVQFESSAGRVASLGGVVRTDVNGQAFDFLEITEVDLESIAGNTVMITARVLGANDVFLSDTATLNVQQQPPIAGFTFVIACDLVTFTNTSTPISTTTDPVEYVWDFGDGTAQLLTNIQNPTPPVRHTYAAPSPTGGYPATLTATNPFGTDMVTNPVVINLTITPMFTFAPASPVVGSAVTFDASTSVVPDLSATYTWDFGDGSSGTGAMVTHTYSAANTVTVTLTINACGNSASASTTFNVGP